MDEKAREKNKNEEGESAQEKEPWLPAENGCGAHNLRHP